MNAAVCSASPFNRTNGGIATAHECDMRICLSVATVRAPFCLECSELDLKRPLVTRERSTAARGPSTLSPESDAWRERSVSRPTVQAEALEGDRVDRVSNDSERESRFTISRFVTERQPFRNINSGSYLHG